MHKLSELDADGQQQQKAASVSTPINQREESKAYLN